MEWIIYVLVGIAVGMSIGYIIGIRRGAQIVGLLLSGMMDGVSHVEVQKQRQTER